MPSVGAITTGAAFVGLASYLFYFDYQRRNSPEFRRELRQRNVKYSKVKESETKHHLKQKQTQIEKLIDDADREAPIPENIKEREAFFMAEISQAEQLVNSGDIEGGALSFYRALVAYPEPMTMLGLYEKSIQHAEVLELVRSMIVIRPPVEIKNFIANSLSKNLD